VLLYTMESLNIPIMSASLPRSGWGLSWSHGRRWSDVVRVRANPPSMSWLSLWNPNAASVKVPRYPGSVGQPQGPLLLSIYARSREAYTRFTHQVLA
jgi:hypothetical protein